MIILGFIDPLHRLNPTWPATAKSACILVETWDDYRGGIPDLGAKMSLTKRDVVSDEARLFPARIKNNCWLILNRMQSNAMECSCRQIFISGLRWDNLPK